MIEPIPISHIEISTGLIFLTIFPFMTEKRALKRALVKPIRMASSSPRTDSRRTSIPNIIPRPTRISEISIFRLKKIGSKIETKKGPVLKQAKVSDTLEIFIA